MGVMAILVILCDQDQTFRSPTRKGLHKKIGDFVELVRDGVGKQ